MKLKHRLYLILLLVSLVPVFVCSIVMLYQNNRNIEKVMTENLKVICDYQIDSIDSFCEQLRADMSVLAQYEFVWDELLISLGERAYVSEEQRKFIESLLEGRKDYYPYVVSLSVVDANFHVVAASENYTVGENSQLAQVSPKVLSEDFFMGDVYIRPTGDTSQQVVLACQKVYYGERLLGYIVEEVLADYFEKYHRDTELWDYGVMRIVDGKGTILTSGGFGEDAENFISEQQRHDVRVEIKRKTDGFAESGAFSYQLDTGRYVTCYSKLTYSDWLVRVTVNLDNYTQQGTTFLVVFFTLLLIATLLLVSVNYFVTDRMTAPIEETCEILKRIQDEEDYFLRIPVAREDEMGELQCEINHLLNYVSDAKRTEKKEQAELTRKTEQDPMTGVYNKKAIARLIEEKSDALAKANGKIAVGFVDIDDFKEYNTLYGHLEGDHVIKFVANTIRGAVHGAVGRYGGDEFVFCMEAQGKEIIEQTLRILMRRLEQGVINGVTGEQMPVPCSIGVIFEDAGTIAGNELVHAADEAMYHAKEKGKNTYHIEIK